MSKELYGSPATKIRNGHFPVHHYNELARQDLLRDGLINDNGDWLSQTPEKLSNKETPLFSSPIRIALWVTGILNVLGLLVSVLLIFSPLKQIWASWGGNPLAPMALSIIPAMVWVAALLVAMESAGK